jgi:hypothetical protein
MTTPADTTVAVTLYSAGDLPRLEQSHSGVHIWFTDNAFIRLASTMSPAGKAAWLRDTADHLADLAERIEDRATTEEAERLSPVRISGRTRP